MKKVNTTSGALRAAKQYLWDGIGGWDDYGHRTDNQSYICDSLGRAHTNEIITKKTMFRVQGMIMGRLYPCISVGHWLHENVGVRQVFGRGYDPYCRQIQLYRHRWVDALIIEYSSQGD